MRLTDDSNYTRLPGGSPNPIGPVQYWLGPDHLLLVEVVWFVEKYRRFDFIDLQALTVRPTWIRVWMWLVLFMALISLTGGGTALVFLAPPAFRVLAVLLLASTAAPLGLALWIVALGPGREVRLTTSVQTVVLPGLRFDRKVEKFRSALVAAVNAAQGSAMGPADVLAGVPGSAAEPVSRGIRDVPPSGT